LEKGGEVNVLSFVVPGQPVAKQRPRFARRGNKVVTYSGKRTVAYESLVRLAFTSAYPDHVPLEGALWVEAIAYFMPPKSFRPPVDAAGDAVSVPHAKRPDADNIAKMLDALNGVAWRDDSQIACLSIDKFYSTTPRLEVSISQIGTEGK
jgi:Holliday junction resolvase RusA-like endonuclease